MLDSESRQQKVDSIIERRVNLARGAGDYIEEYRGFALILDYGPHGYGWPVGIYGEPATVEAHTLCFEDGTNGWIPSVAVDLSRPKDDVVQDLRARIDGWYKDGVQPDQGRVVMVFATLSEAVAAADALILNVTAGES